MPGHQERGELGFRVVIVMALVAGAAWTVPMIFFGRQEVDNAAVLTGASDSQDPGSATSGQAPVDPIGRANDVSAQATLNTAIRSTQVYFAENGTYQGFDATVAGQYDPSVTYTSGPAATGVVSVRGVTATTVVMVTATEEGAYLCAAALENVVTFGRADAQSPAQCSGGW